MTFCESVLFSKKRSSLRWVPCSFESASFAEDEDEDAAPRAPPVVSEIGSSISASSECSTSLNFIRFACECLVNRSLYHRRESLVSFSMVNSARIVVLPVHGRLETSALRCLQGLKTKKDTFEEGEQKKKKRPSQRTRNFFVQNADAHEATCEHITLGSWGSPFQ